METTALPNDIFIKDMEITYAKGYNKISFKLSGDVLSIATDYWELKDLKAPLDDFRSRFVEKPKKVEVAVKPPTEKKVRKDQFAKRWTPEQKKDITERYANGEGPSSIAKDYNVTPNTIHQICIRAGVKRGKVDPVISEALRKIDEASSRKKTDTAYTEKFETPAEQEEREKKQKKALKAFRERQDLPWYLRDSKSKKD